MTCMSCGKTRWESIQKGLKITYTWLYRKIIQNDCPEWLYWVKNWMIVRNDCPEWLCAMTQPKVAPRTMTNEVISRDYGVRWRDTMRFCKKWFQQKTLWIQRSEIGSPLNIRRVLYGWLVGRSLPNATQIWMSQDQSYFAVTQMVNDANDGTQIECHTDSNKY